MNKYFKLKNLVEELIKEKSYLYKYEKEYNAMLSNVYSKRNLDRTIENIKILNNEIKEEKENLKKDIKDV